MVRESPPAFEASQIAERYTLLNRLSEQGGMSEVYRARDRLLGRDVLLKRRALRSGREDLTPDVLLEAQMAASVDHKYVARLYDLLCFSDCYILVMEFVPGASLHRVLELERAMGPLEAIRTTLQCCEGLASLHAKGIIHRDLKPQNIMMAPGRPRYPKLVDFGVSKMVERGMTVAQAGGRSAMTPPYASPEQAREFLLECGGVREGPAHKVDERTDVWALGLTLHEMLTGELPFPDEPRGWFEMLRYRAGCPKPVNRVTERALREVIERVLCPYEKRLPSARAFAAVLRDAERQLRPRSRGASQSRETARRETARRVPASMSQQARARRPMLGWLAAAHYALFVLLLTSQLSFRRCQAPVPAAKSAAPTAVQPVEAPHPIAPAPPVLSEPAPVPQPWGTIVIGPQACIADDVWLKIRVAPRRAAALLASVRLNPPQELRVRAVVSLSDGTPQWFEIEYAPGRYGWVHRNGVTLARSPTERLSCECMDDGGVRCIRIRSLELDSPTPRGAARGQ